jgi:nitrate reductase (cytochrome), electron transfer subunit
MNRPEFQPQKRATWAVGGLLLVLAVTGYFMGLRQSASHISLTRPVETPTADSVARKAQATNVVPGMVSYARLDREKIGPNAGFASHLATLRPALSVPTMLTNVTEELRLEAIAQRRARRAFDGAPPVVPHPIPQDSTASCLACHATGLAIKDRMAPKISHAHYGSCTQCHVPAETGPRITSDPVLLAALTDNVFLGASAPTKGERASPGAPPTIPHTTLMRSDCNSCHGATGLYGLRTPHPDRQSCTQCHAPSATLDQRTLLGLTQP